MSAMEYYHGKLYLKRFRKDKDMEKDWTGNGKSIFTTLGASNHTDKEREINDYYATDPIAIDALLSGGGGTQS